MTIDSLIGIVLETQRRSELMQGHLVWAIYPRPVIGTRLKSQDSFGPSWSKPLWGWGMVGRK